MRDPDGYVPSKYVIGARKRHILPVALALLTLAIAYLLGYLVRVEISGGG